jgi:hypothetical protein
MDETDSQIKIPEELVISKIYGLRGKQVMLDFDLAELYGVPTKQLKRAVRRNIERFPSDFMFELTKEELQNWRSQFGTSNFVKMGLRIAPFAFTDYGVLMLSSILNSDRATKVNIYIIRVFAKMREMLLMHKEIQYKLDELERKYSAHDHKFLIVFEYLKQLEEAKKDHLKQVNRKRIGF